MDARRHAFNKPISPGYPGESASRWRQRRREGEPGRSCVIGAGL